MKTPSNLLAKVQPQLVGRRLIKVRHVTGFGGHGGQRRFCQEFGFELKSWSAYERGTTLIPVTVAVRLMQIEVIEGLDLNWIYLGRARDIPLDLRRLLASAPAHKTSDPEDE